MITQEKYLSIVFAMQNSPSGDFSSVSLSNTPSEDALLHIDIDGSLSTISV
mgnify:CR=1 FL=1